MPKDSPLAAKEVIKRKSLLNMPLICSRQAMQRTTAKNELLEWFGEDFDKLNVVTTYNLVYNAAIMVEEGIGYAIAIDKLVNTTETSNLCFKPLEPKLESGLNIIWKKHQVFSTAAEVFLKKIQENFTD